MKAIVCTKYGPPEVLQLQEVKKPAPGNDGVCVKIFATAVTASDCIVRGFSVPAHLRIPMGLALGFGKPRNPILGMVFAGEVESLGEGARRFEQGDPVYGINIMRLGAYAEYICLPQDGVMALKPSNLTYAEAAAIPYGGLIALHYLRKGNIHDGQRLLIYGASGAVGTCAVQLARHFGAEVTGVCSTTNLELVRSLGAGKVIDYTQEDFTNSGETYDFILDAVGKRKSANIPFKKALAADGKFISIDDGSPKLESEGLEFLKGLLEAGQLKPVIDRTYPLEQMAEAHRYVYQGHKKGNVVITVEHPPG